MLCKTGKFISPRMGRISISELDGHRAVRRPLKGPHVAVMKNNLLPDPTLPVLMYLP